ncbi:Zn-ribbon domain-containing OB-fold protein [Chloroflexota bacterium]
MGFERFGTVSYTADTKAADFIAYLEQGKVMATRCKKCGMKYFPPRMDCAECLDSDVEWFEISGRGELVTYSTVYYGPPQFADEFPFTVAIVDFGDGIKVFGRLSKGIEEMDVKIGMRLKVAPVNLPDDRISYEFQKCD